jgi:hypothetical protein
VQPIELHEVQQALNRSSEDPRGAFGDIMPYKSKKKKSDWQRKNRAKKRAKGLRMKVSWVPFKGLEKIGTQKVKRKAAILPLKTKGTWLKKPPKRGAVATKRAARNGRKTNEIGGKHPASIRKAWRQR